MIIYFGQTDAVVMGMWLNWVQKAFGDFATPKAFTQLTARELAPKTSGSLFSFSKPAKERLIVCGHGSPDSLSDLSPSEFADALLKAGFSNERFDTIYLLNCSVGIQAQDNSIGSNFARAFKLQLGNPPTQGIKVYAPRGAVRWEGEWIQKNTGKFLSITRVYVHTPEKEYPLTEGMLLVL